MKVELGLLRFQPRHGRGYGVPLLLGLLFCLMTLGMVQAASLQPEMNPKMTPELDQEAWLKPLVDHSQSEDTASRKLTPIEGRAARRGDLPVNDAPGSSTRLITGKVETLQQAIESEKDTVDWYGWYLSAREYISRNGGLRCSLGTPIKFYRNGRIEALTFDTACVGSVLGKRFPLPESTRLDALILPVRPGHGPPASESEIYSRIRTKY